MLSQGISTDKQSGLTCRALSECGCSGIHHPADTVRKVAERVLLLVYKVNPRLVRKQLPPDDDITRRNLLYRQLFTEFDKLDNERRREMLDANRGGPLGILRNSTPPYSPNSANLSSIQTDSTQSEARSSQFTFSNGSNTNSADSTTVNSPRKFAENRPINKTLVINGKEQLPRKASNSDSIEDSECENRCPFCDWPYNGSEQLDKHYWKACPVLTKCPQCSQVLEVAALCAHLTSNAIFSMFFPWMVIIWL